MPNIPTKQPPSWLPLQHGPKEHVGNSVIPLINGEGCYGRMLHSIAAAKKSIFLCTYQFDDDSIGNLFLKELSNAVSRGATVRVLIDAIGALVRRPILRKKLFEAGIPVAMYSPISARRLARINNRNHRKILAIDSDLAFVGGINIMHPHMVSEASNPLQDIHFQVTGPVTQELENIFIQDWKNTTGELLHSNFFEKLHTDDITARAVASGPQEGFGGLYSLVEECLNRARTQVLVMTPYFIPDDRLSRLLAETARRGIDVRILIPARNFRVMDWACKSILPPLLHAGCKVLLNPPPFDHSKITIVDSTIVLIGSPNWDARSFNVNLEVLVECHGEILAQRLKSIFQDRSSKAIEYSIADAEKTHAGSMLKSLLLPLVIPFL